jgi:hypothetical protein
LIQLFCQLQLLQKQRPDGNRQTLALSIINECQVMKNMIQQIQWPGETIIYLETFGVYLLAAQEIMLEDKSFEEELDTDEESDITLTLVIPKKAKTTPVKRLSSEPLPSLPDHQRLQLNASQETLLERNSRKVSRRAGKRVQRSRRAMEKRLAHLSETTLAFTGKTLEEVFRPLDPELLVKMAGLSL